MNAVTSPFTWSFLTTLGIGPQVLAAPPLVRPIPKPAAFDPTLCSGIVTGTEGTETLSATEETALAWFLAEDGNVLVSTTETLHITAMQKPPLHTTAANAFFAAMQAMTCNAKAQT